MSNPNDLDKTLDNVLNSVLPPKTLRHSGDMSSMEAKTPAVAEDIAGLAWVSNGRIFVKDPESGGAPARLAPSGLKVLVNGVPVQETVPIRESDHIEYEPRIELIPPCLEVVISDDGLVAYLNVAFGRRVEYVLEDQEPSTLLTLRAKPVSHPGEPPDLDQALAVLKQKGVTYGIHLARLRQLRGTPEEGRFIVASGIPPGISQAESVEILFGQGEFCLSPDKRNNVDFRECRRLATVEQGQLLARKIPGKLGTPGMNVRGEALLPEPPQSIQLLCGQGTALADGGNTVIATTSGQPFCEKHSRTYFFRVESVYSINGDIDLSVGNVRFVGSISVRGNVRAGVLVYSAEDIYVSENVDNAQMVAYRSITIGGSVFGSTVIAGCCNRLSFQKVAGQLAHVINQLSLLLQVLEEVHANPRVRHSNLGFGQLLQRVVDLRFGNLPAEVHNLLNSLRRLTIAVQPEDIRASLIDFEYYFDGINLLRLQSIEQLHLLYHKLKVLASLADEAEDTGGNLVLKSAVNSSLAASGTISIVGQGCYCSRVEAGGDVNVRGIVRGGHLISKKGAIVVDEAGSDLGVKTVLSVNPGGHVFMGRAYPGVYVNVGNQVLTIKEDVCHMRVYLDSQGKLRF
ncbi:DUF342 domain-containing protein [Desulforudis sp. 1088]|uniref:DUF342 domain-containing protein n=1 Tax=unclassified Candidatus Desulforudis TaxID=2635950 RepID=UPI003CE591F3